MSTISEIRQILCGDAGAIAFLDNLVHDNASALANAINNDGLKAQLEFLNQRGITDEEILKQLQQEVER